MRFPIELSRIGGAALLALSLALGACDAGSGESKDERAQESEGTIVQPGAPGRPTRKLTAAEAEKLEQAKHTDADVRFMRGMIHHHAQALVMTSMVRSRSASDAMPLFARRMELSQETEMRQMEQWLRDRGEAVPTAAEHKHDHGGGGSLMPGMVSAAALDRLADSDGRGFDLLFLRYMQRHHRGALEMVRRLDEGGGGMEAEIGAFARHVQSDQDIEIKRMEDLRARILRGETVSGVRRAKVPKGLGTAKKFAFAGGRPLICVIG
jgi:uncharacterized protein (DUF305 family)